MKTVEQILRYSDTFYRLETVKKVKAFNLGSMERVQGVHEVHISEVNYHK